MTRGDHKNQNSSLPLKCELRYIKVIRTEKKIKFATGNPPEFNAILILMGTSLQSF